MTATARCWKTAIACTLGYAIGCGASQTDRTPSVDASTDRASAWDGATDVQLLDGPSPEPQADVVASDSGGRLADATAANDPCPSSGLPPLVADCAGDCADSAAATTNCPYLTCPTGADPSLNPNIVDVSTLPAVIRTPVGAEAACVSMCSADAGGGPHDPVTSAIVFSAHIPSGMWLQVTVEPPWWVQALAMSSAGSFPDVVCADTNAAYRQSPCLWWDGPYIEVGTEDPNPTARNILIQLVPAGTSSCPR